LVQGIAEGLGIGAPVRSPTFTLVHEYDHPSGRDADAGQDQHAGLARPGPPISRAGLVHMDFYRLSSPAEARALGLEDYLDGDDVVVVEWPERAEGVLPASGLHVTLAFEADDPTGEGRCLTLEARGEAAAAALSSLLARLPAPGTPRSPVPGAGPAHG
jgi:tRNA threonylcarbamoyladenosine biosynthesis protein TsaE